jgi:spermidine/putrescine ABC transporter ATP-binding subunit
VMSISSTHSDQPSAGTGEPPAAPEAGDGTLRVHGAPLSLQGLERRFGDVVAVQDLSLDIAAGEFVTLLGASGSGKTTTLLMIAGFQTPTRGSIVLDGKPVTNLPPHQRNMGMVFQSYALFPHKTVFENIAFPLRRRKLPRKEIAARVREALDLVHLGHTASRYPRELSGGQQQRIAVARATVYRPRLLLMDEPLSALDKNLREELQGEVRRIHRDLGTTVVYVTHDQDEALALSDRIVLMRDGSVEQDGPPDDVYRRPRTTYAAGFLGEINMLRGRLTATGPDGHAAVRLHHGADVAGTLADAGALKAGDDVAVAVRPEDLQLVEPGAPGSVRVAIEETAYLGRSVRCVGKFETGERCTLWVEPQRAGEVAASSDVAICWPAQAATVIDCRDAAQAEAAPAATADVAGAA